MKDSNERVISIFHWGIARILGDGQDPIGPHGKLVGQPEFTGFGMPSTFKSFDPSSRTATSITGKVYRFEDFSRPSCWAKNEEEAFRWIEKNFVKKDRP